MKKFGNPILWKERNPDIKINSIQDLFAEFGLIDGSKLCYQSMNGSCILVKRYAVCKIRKHLIKKRVELGGLLVGKVYSITMGIESSYVIVINNAIPSIDFKSNSVSLHLGTDIWNSARKYLNNGLIIVGWYHSHPGFGAFFSATDRKTQKNFFKENFQVGLVVDPFRNEEKWFLGEDSQEIKPMLKY